VAQGGWFPLVVGVLGFFIFTTWRKGRELLAAEIGKTALPLEALVEDLQRQPVLRVPGTAVLLNSSPHSTPIGLLHNLKLNRILHERNLVVTVVTEEVPYVAAAERLQVQPLAAGFSRLIIRYGFMQDPNVPAALSRARNQGMDFDASDAVYILSDNTLIPSRGAGMSAWRKRVFAFLSRNAVRPTQFFRLPANRVLQIGMQIDL
jgi:KUP system potassium uptake protein